MGFNVSNIPVVVEVHTAQIVEQIGKKIIDFSAMIEPYINQMVEKVMSTHAWKKVVNFTAVIEPYKNQAMEKIMPHATYITNEITTFASAHPVLTATVASIVLLALTLKIALVVSDRFDRCCKSRKLDNSESHFNNLPLNWDGLRRNKS